MAYLDYLLRKTMLLTADRDLKPVKSFKIPTVGALPSADLKALNDDDKAILTRGIWQYECNGLTEVKNVAVRDRTSPGDPLRTVFDSIRWGTGEGANAHVKAFRNGNGGQEQTIKLPLTKSFLLRTYFLSKGKISETKEQAGTPMMHASIWQLATNLCSSFQYIFGYELNEKGEASPISNPEAEGRGDWVEMTNSYTVGGQSVRVVIPPLPRILVCLGLGCATERKDFEPGGVLGAARIHPHFMFLTNTPLKRMEAEITCARPAQSKTESTTPGKHHHHSAHDHSSHGGGSDSGSMNPGIEMAFYTDANIPTYIGPEGWGGKPSPYWDELFDYYLIAPPTNEAMTVVSSKLAQSRNLEVKRASEKSQPFRSPVALPYPYPAPQAIVRQGLEYNRSKTVSKLPRQGEFDNVHIAPTMKMPQRILDEHPWKELERISMAPFCAHDCLHMHWRWGQNKSYPRYSSGWGGTAEKPEGPFQTSGAPLVPANQDIHLRTLSTTAFVYRAVIHQPQPLVWQTVMHHGAAYSLSVGSDLLILMAVDDALSDDFRGQEWLDEVNFVWPILYWNLRYRTLITSKIEKDRGLKDSFLERLSLPAAKLKELREVELLKKLSTPQQAVKPPAVSRRPPAARSR